MNAHAMCRRYYAHPMFFSHNHKNITDTFPLMRNLILIALLAISAQVFAGNTASNDTIQAALIENTAVTAAQAQTIKGPRIGYFSYETILKSMPEYAIVQAKLAELKATYDAEIESVMKEFNEKYEYFLDNQRVMADVIREKRQAELQSMMERNAAFRQETNRLLKQAEEEAMLPIHGKISKAIEVITTKKAYLMIVNTDSEACPYINPNLSEDVTDALAVLLK